MRAVITRSKTKRIFLFFTHSYFELESSGLRDEIRYHYMHSGRPPDRGASVPAGRWAVAQGCTVSQRLPSPPPHRLQQVCPGP